MEPPLNFKYIHAADLHLDSPLRGLAAKSEAAAERVQTASREALEAMIDLAIAEQCKLIVIAGDLFDGQWKDYRTGLYFATQMARLKAAQVPVYIIQGNHDAENNFVARLELSENVKLFSSKKPESFVLDSIKVAVHGQSFATREVKENIALRYPPPLANHFNIGVLHTALEGHTGMHASYAPCSTEQLKNHGYDYWALGHVHDYMLLHDTQNPADPHIVYSGVVQGRNIRETGAKGVVLVTVEDGAIVAAEFKPLGTVVWHSCPISAEGLDTQEALLCAAIRSVEDAYQNTGKTSCAVRVTITGPTPARSSLLTNRTDFQEQLETALAAISEEGDIWLEKLVLNISEPATVAEQQADDPTIAGGIASLVRQAAEGEEFDAAFRRIVDELRSRFPQTAADEGFLDSLVDETRLAARDLALAILETSQTGNGEAE